jgi:predicted enzyme related to lactoylglutathione lyase
MQHLDFAEDIHKIAIPNTFSRRGPMRPPLVWFEAVGQHGDKLRGFYRELLGWNFEPHRPPPAPPSRWRLRAPSLRRKAAPPPKPVWFITFYTRVPDLDAAIAKARELGSQVLVPPTRHGDTLIAVVSDPEGHPVGLCS